MTNLTENLDTKVARDFLSKLGLLSSLEGSASLPGRCQKDLEGVFLFLCERAIGGVVQENLAVASPEGNLFVWLESWRAAGGEDRGRATMRASELLTEAAKQTLGLDSRKSGFAPEMLYSAWGVFRKWIEEDSERREYLLRRVEPLVQEFRSSAAKAALFEADIPGKPWNHDRGGGVPVSSPTLPSPLQTERSVQVGLDVAVEPTRVQSALTKAESPWNEPAPQAVDTSALWQYLPLPDGLDRHEEYATASQEALSEQLVFGARVRGRKHKHDGTNCDDWFEFDTVGNWTLMAVSDGAGSCAFSRVGSRAACSGGITSLRQSLNSLHLSLLSQNDLHISEDRVFRSKELEAVQESLHRAMRDAREAMGRAVENRNGDSSYELILGRPLTIKDLSATLLLAVHTRITLDGQEMDLVLSCQVGDGMIAAISQGLSMRLLAKPDSGVYSGETEFLTSPRKLEDVSLRQNTHVFIGSLKALMLMTDGVSDDYFPSDPGMKLLYADLCLNRILPLPALDEAKLQEALEARGKTRMDLAFETNSFLCTRLMCEDQRQQMLVRSIRPMSKHAGLDPCDVVATTELLAAFGAGDPMLPDCAALSVQDRLLLWLDSYTIRGSFDDRTMVVLFKEA